ncbi:MAG: CRISPR-associated endonuclease Cas2 [Phocaeicola plebeius]|nr:CRISPR-associated endonuclease Cas2 [Phocaeicola plebeius]
MIIVSYDIADDKMRTRFAKMLKGYGAIRLQLSVYEVQNTKRIVDNIMAKIEAYAKHFTNDDSVVVFEVDTDKLIKYGNAIHRDQPLVIF